MIRITKKEAEERYNKLPQNIAQYMFSENIIDFVWFICESNHLDQERTKGVAALVGYTTLGFIYPDHLGEAIADHLNIDRRVANHIGDEINDKVLSPIIKDLYKFYKDLASAPAETENEEKEKTSLPSTPTGEKTQPVPPTEQIKPALEKPAVNAQETISAQQPAENIADDQASPYVIHTEGADIKQTTRAGGEADLVRPYFYDPAQSSLPKEERPVAARLEIGGEGGMKKKKPKKAGEANIRVVHYSGPQTPVDPFQGQPEKDAVQPEAKPSDPSVHPDNIVNLKDVPK